MAIDPIAAEVRAARVAIDRVSNNEIRLTSTLARMQDNACGRRVVSFAAPSSVGKPIAAHLSNGNVIDAGLEGK